MTILQLKYFEAVYAARSMTRAAERLYVSQPSVSTAIKELEEEIGAQLFLRTNPLQPTQAGQTLADMAAPLLQNFEHLQLSMRKIGCEHAPLRLGISITAKQLMHTVFDENLEVLSASLSFLGFYGNDYLMRCIQENRLDLAIITTVGTNELNDFNSNDLSLLQVRLYAHRNNPLCAFNTLDPRQLQNAPMAAFSEYPMSSTEFDSMMNDLLGCTYTSSIQFFSTNLMDIEQAIESGRISCVLLQGLLSTNSNIRAIPLETNKSIHFSVIWKKDHFLHPDELAFIQSLEKRFSRIKLR